MDFVQFINNFAALLVICNPLSALPAVLRITAYQTPLEKRRIGLTSAIAVLIILLLATWTGSSILRVLGIQLPAFQVAGGSIIFMMAISMLQAETSKQKIEEKTTQSRGDNGAVVPLAIPLIAGPGAISAIIVRVSEFPGIFNLLLHSLSALLVSFSMGLLLFFANDLEKVLGSSRINIINRLGGLILAAIAVQMLANGITDLFPFLSGEQKRATALHAIE